MTQTHLQPNIQLHHLTGLPIREKLYNDIALHSKGNLNLLLFSIAKFPYRNLPPWESDRIIIQTKKMLATMLPEDAMLYQWRDYSFAVLLPYYNKDFAQKWQRQVLKRSQKIKLPAQVLAPFSLLYGSASFPPTPINKLLQEAETGLQTCIEKDMNSFWNQNPLEQFSLPHTPKVSSAGKAKAKEYIQFALAHLWAKDPYFIYLHHASAIYAKALGVQLGLDKEAIKILETAALWQDVGMNDLPLDILCSTEPLQSDDWEQIKKHPAIGAELLNYLNMDAGICLSLRHHHENWNGSGYPNNLRAEKIPLHARILRIATSWASLQLPRPWRKAYTSAEALSMLQKGAGQYYDPHLVKEFRCIVQNLPSPQNSLQQNA